MTDLVNLLVELDERYASDASLPVRDALESAGYTVGVERSADDRTLAWIDATFGGAWSSEAYAGSNVIVRRDGAPIGFATFDPVERRFAWLRGAACAVDTGVFGPFGVDPAHRGGIVGVSILTLALGALRERSYARALIAAVGDRKLIAYYERNAGARIAERFDLTSFTPTPVRTVVLASGNGSNFQAVIDAVERGLPLEICGLIANKSGAHALERARNASILPIALTWKRASETRAQYDARLLATVAELRPELVLLLGWMHVLDEAFIGAFPELINVHPAFLPLDSSRNSVGMPDGTTIPAFRGAHAVADALQARSRWVGVSVHTVTAMTDRGPILVRKPLAVGEEEDEASVLVRLHPIEHELVERGIRRWLYER